MCVWVSVILWWCRCVWFGRETEVIPWWERRRVGGDCHTQWDNEAYNKLEPYFHRLFQSKVKTLSHQVTQKYIPIKEWNFITLFQTWIRQKKKKFSHFFLLGICVWDHSFLFTTPAAKHLPAAIGCGKKQTHACWLLLGSWTVAHYFQWGRPCTYMVPV